jgi:hypothetical protein
MINFIIIKIKKEVAIMKKKTFMILTVIISMMFLSACSGDGVSLKVTGDGVDIKAGDSSSGTQEDIFGNNNSGGSSNNNSSSKQQPSNDSIVAKLTPQGATVTYYSANADGGFYLDLESNKSLSELITFYEAALRDLGAKLEDMSRSSDSWRYSGTYNGKDIDIDIDQSESIFEIDIKYWD